IPTSIGAYLSDFGLMASRSGATGGETMSAWLQSWTVFYWAWWISWTPFVGMFIARISRGRTIREFVGGVLLVPSAISVVWFAIFGGTAIGLEMDGAAVAVGGAEAQTFNVLAHLPLLEITSAVVMVLVGRRAGPRRAPLRVGVGRSVDRGGHAVAEGIARAVAEDRDLLWRGDRGRRRDHARDRRRQGALRRAEPHVHRGTAVHRRYG